MKHFLRVITLAAIVTTATFAQELPEHFTGAATVTTNGVTVTGSFEYVKDFDSGNWRVRFTPLPGSAALGLEDSTMEVPVVTSTFDGFVTMVIGPNAYDALGLPSGNPALYILKLWPAEPYIRKAIGTSCATVAVGSACLGHFENVTVKVEADAVIFTGVVVQ